MPADLATKPEFVLDSSFALAWFFPDEGTPRTTAVFDRLLAAPGGAPGGAIAPALLWIETANAALVAERKGRVESGHSARLILLFGRFDVRREDTTDDALLRATALARQHSLTVYDALYLEMALRLAIPLATLDARLERAADVSGVGAA